MTYASKKIKSIFTRHIPELIKTGLIKGIPAVYGNFKYRPQYAALNITDNCCFKCVMCNQGRAQGADELSTSEWKETFKQLKNIGIGTISFAGGEPFFRKDIVELIAYSKSIDLVPVVVTNGYLLEKELIEEAVAAGVKTFSLSVDAIGNDFDNIRGVKGAYERVVRACEIVSEYKKKGEISAYLYFTLMRKTLLTYKDVFALAKKLDFPLVVNLVDYTPYFFTNLSDNKHDFWIESPDTKALKNFQKFIVQEKQSNTYSVYHNYCEINYFQKYFRDPLQKEIPCVVSQQRLGIDSRGNVYGGCWSMGSFGNLQESSLEAIVNSSKYKAVHRDMFSKRCPGCSCGYVKNIRSFLPAAFEELMYRLLPSSRKRIYA